MIPGPVGNSLVSLFSALAGPGRPRALRNVAPGSPADGRGAADTTAAGGPERPPDTIELSPQAIEAARRLRGAVDRETAPPLAGTAEVAGASDTGERAIVLPGARPGGNGDRAGRVSSPAPGERTGGGTRTLTELRRRDREVRAHEQAHVAAGGAATLGGPTFTFQTGPDGKRYAVAGEVPIRVTSPSDDPRDRIKHALGVQRAALAPADPSDADRATAARAARELARARAELRDGSAERGSGTVSGRWAEGAGGAAASVTDPSVSSIATGAGTTRGQVRVHSDARVTHRPLNPTGRELDVIA